MKTEPLSVDDFSRGIYRETAIRGSLAPKNSVALSQNINYDTVLGKAVVRSGTTLLGATIASNKTPLGLAEFVGPGAVVNDLMAVFSGASTATVYFYDTAWRTSGLTTLSNTAKNRFATFGGSCFITNGTDVMRSATTTTIAGITTPWGTTNCLVGVLPTTLFVAKQVMLATGDSTYRSRVYFSTVIDPTKLVFITWDTTTVGGAWMDINPDDGDYNTAIAETSNYVLVFKNRAFYRLDVVNKTVDTERVFNFGTPSQEAVTICQGKVYFFTGQDIQRTDGGFPEQITRLGCQDFIDAIPQTSWTSVALGNDGFNVYASIGTVTIQANTAESFTYTNVILKFSVRDETWSMHSYGNVYTFFSQFTTSAGRTLVGASTAGDIQTMNSGLTDNTKAISFFLETQRVSFGGKTHTYKISDMIVVRTRYGQDSSIQIKGSDSGYQDLNVSLEKRVNVCKDINIEANEFKFKWKGQTTGAAPQLEGIYVPFADDMNIPN